MHKLNNLFTFLYLNKHPLLLFLAGGLNLIIPYKILSNYLIILQILISISLFSYGIKLISTWNDKKKKYDILIKKNSQQFRPDTFKLFMEAPCGRDLTKVVLHDLGKKDEYKNLLKYKPKLSSKLRRTNKNSNIYINKKYLNK